MRFLERFRARFEPENVASSSRCLARSQHASISLLILLLEMYHIDLLILMPGPDVGHYVGRLLAAEFAVGTLEAGWLAAFVFVMPGHVSLDSEATAASGTVKGLVVGTAFQMVDVPRAALRIIIRHRHGRAVLIKVSVITLGLKTFARLHRKVQIQQRGRRVET